MFSLSQWLLAFFRKMFVKDILNDRLGGIGLNVKNISIISTAWRSRGSESDEVFLFFILPSITVSIHQLQGSSLLPVGLQETDCGSDHHVILTQTIVNGCTSNLSGVSSCRASFAACNLLILLKRSTGASFTRANAIVGGIATCETDTYNTKKWNGIIVDFLLLTTNFLVRTNKSYIYRNDSWILIFKFPFL